MVQELRNETYTSFSVHLWEEAAVDINVGAVYEDMGKYPLVRLVARPGRPKIRGLCGGWWALATREREGVNVWCC